jgi:hypothetical protein
MRRNSALSVAPKDVKTNGENGEQMLAKLEELTRHPNARVALSAIKTLFERAPQARRSPRRPARKRRQGAANNGHK